jgi:hypothetical protein
MPKRALAVLIGAALFGVAVAVIKGGDSGVRDSIGNVSAPWLLLPYFAGRATRGWGRGAILGTLACLVSLLAFYVAEAFVLDLGGHSMLTNLRLTAGSFNIYYQAGMVCAPLLGALGGARLRYRSAVTAAVVGLLLIGEPLAVFAWLAHAGVSPSDGGMVTHYPALWIGEMALGLALGGAVLVTNTRRVADPSKRLTTPTP